MREIAGVLRAARFRAKVKKKNEPSCKSRMAHGELPD
jgi:hypothetical protein